VRGAQPTAAKKNAREAKGKGVSVPPWIWWLRRDPRPAFGWRWWQVAMVAIAFAFTAALASW